MLKFEVADPAAPAVPPSLPPPLPLVTYCSRVSLPLGRPASHIDQRFARPRSTRAQILSSAPIAPRDCGNGTLFWSPFRDHSVGSHRRNRGHAAVAARPRITQRKTVPGIAPISSRRRRRYVNFVDARSAGRCSSPIPRLRRSPRPPAIPCSPVHLRRHFPHCHPSPPPNRCSRILD